MAWENYGFAFVIDERVGARRRRHDRRLGSRDRGRRRMGGRPGYNAPGNVVTGLLAGFEPQAVRAAHAGARPGQLRQQQQRACRRTSAGCVGGPLRRHRNGRQRARADAQRRSRRSSPDRCGRRSGCRTRSRTSRSWTRSRPHVKADPVAYRLRHLQRPAADATSSRPRRRRANWETRPSPRPGMRGGPASRRGRGMSCVLYEGDNGYCAMVAEVDVDQDTGRVIVKRLVIAERLRSDLESRRPAESARRRRAAGHEPRAHRRSDLGRSEGDVDRLADLSAAVSRRRRADDRDRAAQPARRARRRAPARRRSPSSRPRSPTRSSTPPARGFVRRRSRRSA